MDSNRDLARKIEAMEMRYDEQFSAIFDAIKQLIADDQTRKPSPSAPSDSSDLPFCQKRIPKTPWSRNLPPGSSSSGRDSESNCRQEKDRAALVSVLKKHVSPLRRSLNYRAASPWLNRKSAVQQDDKRDATNSVGDFARSHLRGSRCPR